MFCLADCPPHVSSGGGCCRGGSDPLSSTSSPLHLDLSLQSRGAGVGRAADGPVPRARGEHREHRAPGAGGDPRARPPASLSETPQGETGSVTSLEEKEEVDVLRLEDGGACDLSRPFGTLLEGGALPYACQRKIQKQELV